jgi:TRAP-type C4-dicarboxylate transport system permease large subunit
MVLLGAAMLNSALAISQIPAAAAAWTQTLDTSPILIVAGFLLCFVLLTTVLDELAMMLLLLPIVLPIIFGFDLFGLTQEQKAIWFGIMMLMVTSFGLIAPPIGLNVYVVSNIARSVPIREIYLGILPFLLFDVLRVVLLFLVPSLSLWLVAYIK